MHVFTKITHAQEIRLYPIDGMCVGEGGLGEGGDRIATENNPKRNGSLSQCRFPESAFQSLPLQAPCTSLNKVLHCTCCQHQHVLREIDSNHATSIPPPRTPWAGIPSEAQGLYHKQPPCCLLLDFFSVPLLLLLLLHLYLPL